MSLLRCLLIAAVAAAPLGKAHFTPVTSEVGLAGANVGRAQLIDVDQDGWLDLCVGGENPSLLGSYRIYLNRPKEGDQRHFVAAPETPFGLEWVSFAVWGDVNNDGRIDALTVARQNGEDFKKNPRSHKVFLGDGKGRFVGLEGSGFERSEHCNTLAAVLSDLDQDGILDAAFGQAYVKDGEGHEAQQMRVYRGLGTGKFSDVTAPWGFVTPGPPGAANGSRPLYGLTATDLDNDGCPELLGAAYGRQWNTLWMRPPQGLRFNECGAKFALDGDSIRHGKYSEATREKFRQRNEPRPDELPFRSNGNTFCLAPGDFDGDGDIDLFSADITHAWAGDSSDLSALLINRLETFKEPFFERCIEVLDGPDRETGFRARPTRGLARDHAPQSSESWNQGDLQAYWADLDCDGLLDLVICESDYPHNRLRIFLQTPEHTFRESERELGLVFPNCPGIALGDYDRDGDLDIVATGTRTRWPEAREKPELAMWRNDSSGENGFLCVRLIGDGTTTNRDAIGARIYLTSDQGSQSREVLGPHGHWGQQTQPGEVHFGLGTAKPQSLRIVWPDGRRSETQVAELPERGWLVIQQGKGVVEKMNTFEPKRWSVNP